jgi:hypothetical protein
LDTIFWPENLKGTGNLQYLGADRKVTAVNTAMNLRVPLKAEDLPTI